VKLTTHLQLVPRPRKRGYIHPLLHTSSSHPPVTEMLLTALATLVITDHVFDSRPWHRYLCGCLATFFSSAYKTKEIDKASIIWKGNKTKMEDKIYKKLWSGKKQSHCTCL
jgi:hypothetical protein